MNKPKAMSHENQSIQRKWCENTTQAHVDGAIESSRFVMQTLLDNGIEVGPVIEIGPRYGDGTLELLKQAVSVLGVELVPEFHQTCLDAGLDCVLGAAEDILDLDIPGKYNFYMRDVVEHFVDRDKAMKGIKEKLLNWIFISVPVEPVPTENISHVTRFRSIQEAQSLFEGLTPVYEDIRHPTPSLKGRYVAIWAKQRGL